MKYFCVKRALYLCFLSHNNKGRKQISTFLVFIGIGSVHKRTGEALAFLCNWSTVFILQPTAIAVLALTFSQYLLSGVVNGNLFY